MSGKGGVWIAGLGLAVWFPAASAMTFAVNSQGDAVDALPGDGVCATAAGSCTLRAAIQEANARAGADSVTLPAGTYVLSLAGANEELAATGDLDIRESLSVVGAGSSQTVLDGNLSDRLFHSLAGTTLSLRGVTLQHGQLVSGDGGGVLALGDLNLQDVVMKLNTAAQHGGGLYQAGVLRATATTLQDNTATRGGGLYLASGSATLDGATIRTNVAVEGAGIYALVSLTARTSTLTANRADTFGGGGYLGAGATFEDATITNNVALDAGAGLYAQGGALSLLRTRFDANSLTSNYATGAGLYVGTNGSLVLNGSEFTNNLISKATVSGTTYGGGLYFAGTTAQGENNTWSGNVADVGGGVAVAAGSAQLRYSTLASNTAGSGSNLAATGPGTVSVAATLFADPLAGANCSGSVTTLGYNVETGASCAFTGTGDKSNAVSGLGLLDATTGTHALVAGSAAIDAGIPGDCPLLDGAGFVRIDAQCDAGAREAGAVPASGGTLRFELASSEFGEAAGSVTLRVLREGGNVPVSVDYVTVAGSATEGVDYLPSQGKLTWAATDTGAKFITVTIVEDTLVEPGETFQLLLKNVAGGAVLGTPDSHTITILDNDVAAVTPPPDNTTPTDPSTPPPSTECLNNNPHCVPPGQAKKGGGSVAPVWLLAGLLLWVARRRPI